MNGPVIARGMTSAVGKLPTRGSGESRPTGRSSTGRRGGGHVHVVRDADIMVFSVRLADTRARVSGSRTIRRLAERLDRELLRQWLEQRCASGVLTRTGHRGRVRRRGEDVGRCNRVVRSAPGSGPSLRHRGRVSASGDDAGGRQEREGGSLAMRSPHGWALASGERAGSRVRRQRTGSVDQAFFVGPALVDGDFGLSRLRYDSPSITRS